MFGIHGTKSYLCIVKGYSRQGMSDKERSWFYFPVVLSRFCPVRDLYHDTRLYNIVEYQCFVNGESEKNALTTSNHQKHPIFILSLFATLGMSKSQPKRLLTESSQSGNGQDRNASLHKYSLQTAYMRKNIAYMPFFLMRIKNHSAERKKSFSADWKNEMTKNGKKPFPICFPNTTKRIFSSIWTSPACLNVLSESKAKPTDADRPSRTIRTIPGMPFFYDSPTPFQLSSCIPAEARDCDISSHSPTLRQIREPRTGRNDILTNGIHPLSGCTR